MYKCPNCAGNLKFDIARQQLYCEYCGTQADPYSFSQERGAEEKQAASGEMRPGEDAEEYEVTVFTCPQCGSEILSEDDTAATFCSFCGAAAILDSRVSRERRPRYILPFTQTREDCRVAYGKLLRRAVFAPKELKDEALIEKFRGIYMPYWVYSFEKKEAVSFSGRKTRRRGDYRITDHYQLNCQIEEEYQGLAYDASSAFSDSLSGAIAPFDLRQGKAFTPSFLSGFYADTSDVGKYVYQLEAEELVFQDARKNLLKNPVCRKYRAGQGEDRFLFEKALRPSGKTVELAMLPVWFLAYRNGDRVSYAVVNGQTGKAAADLPVDRKKYLLGSLLLAVPLFFLCNLFLTVTPGRILLLAVLLALFCMFISNEQLTRILARESGEDDKGYRSRMRETGETGGKAGNTALRRRGALAHLKESVVGKVFLICFLFYGITLFPAIFFRILGAATGNAGLGSFQIIMIVEVLLMFAGFPLLFSLLGGRKGKRSGKKPFLGGHFKEKRSTLQKPLAGILTAAVIWIFHPVSDWFYYIGAFVCMGTVLWAILDIIKQHNLLAARKLPQLGRRGGDEVA